MLKKILRCAVSATLALSILAAPCLAAAPEQGNATVTADALNLRSEPNTESAVKAVIYNGSYLVVTGSKGDWYDVIYDGTEGFVHSDYVDYALTADTKFGTTGTVRGMSVRMRSGPELSAKVLGYYNTGATFTVLGISGEWVRVSTKAGIVGYIHSDYIVCSSASNTLTSNYDSRGAAIVASAKEYMGVPYVWAGTSPYGFDCSGLVMYVYALHGYSMYRVAQDMYYYDGVHVDRSELKAGDVICFGYGRNSITHVGIYIGDGQFIHASSGGGCVMISSLVGYYDNMYVGAKRLIG
ncbi:MAG: C40 family peptidase [Oscillospiraceae bacterium]|nr:C40 family peptidase [Oscillospiraceae bacterium]